ncbi:MAG TPA: 3-phosphoserine/phosphohydroxythreonine transaminase [Pirellulales bacterium]|nr:3-phosphoserine/phosphohydroxythreonine transaminase [Pirellulales bacterium]
MVERVFNFSPGPAVLPLPVLEEAQRHLLSLPGVGISVLEISHRSKPFEAIMAETKQALVELLGIPSGYQILFLQGGSSLQFSMVPMNLLAGNSADYIVTGSWGQKALEEARKEGEVRAAWDGKADNYNRLPAAGELKLSPTAAYVHVTSNETIQGVQFRDMPKTGNVPLVADLSSDFLSRPVPVEQYGMIYACAQKNAGISGVTVVIVRDELLARSPEKLSSMLDYRVLAKNDSLLNTPPVFAIYILSLITRWLKNDVGGLAKMAKLNDEKAKLLHDVLDESGGFYRGHAKADCRSAMNVTWRLPSEELEATFVKEAKAKKLHELKGHRSVGGIRASIYNAMPIEGVRELRDFMLDFQKRNAR